jgi:hypothetical protein
MNRSVSSHYLLERGERYLKVFDNLEIGRLYQCEKYFSKYCNDESVIIDLGSADGLFLANLPAKRRIGVEANPAARSRTRDMEIRFGVTIETFDSPPVSPMLQYQTTVSSTYFRRWRPSGSYGVF